MTILDYTILATTHVHIHVCMTLYNTSTYKNNCLKLKSEVRMAVLKANKSTRDNQHKRTVNPYTCISRQSV